MGIEQIITLNITRSTTTPSRLGFGTPMVAGYFPTSIFAERSRSYSGLQGMVDDGFQAGDPIYKAASNIFAQNPSPPQVKIGRRANAPQQVIHVTPSAPFEGQVYSLAVTGYADNAFASRVASSDSFEFTATPATTDAEDVVNAFVALLPTTGDFSATATGTGANAKLVITALNTTMDGMLFGVTVSDSMTVEDLTTDPGIEADLSAINTYDPDWYGLCLDSNSSLEIQAAADWVQSNLKQFVCQTQDPDVANVPAISDTASVAYELKNNSYTRTMLFFHRDNMDFVCGAMLGRALPETAGSITWAHKELQSTAGQNLTTNQLNNLKAKDVNALVPTRGVNATRWGSSSEGEYMDVIRGADNLKDDISVDVFGALINNDKIPYTDAGIQSIRGLILAQLDNYVARGYLAASPEPTCTVPRAADVSAADKGARALNNVTFRAVLAGAIHTVAIEGELTLT